MPFNIGSFMGRDGGILEIVSLKRSTISCRISAERIGFDIGMDYTDDLISLLCCLITIILHSLIGATTMFTREC
ncbi:unnamed protein product [Nippostrongylus brasiliensis]|uniref:Uncharacterized protein n=1 Tax=Nippostrongylus brasiliensis TaxID=27835 RepID=A0A0N4YLP7_NIPBR|nr:unnamed protein product [Nippostrongylus brasiliensis]